MRVTGNSLDETCKMGPRSVYSFVGGSTGLKRNEATSIHKGLRLPDSYMF